MAGGTNSIQIENVEGSSQITTTTINMQTGGITTLFTCNNNLVIINSLIFIVNNPLNGDDTFVSIEIATNESVPTVLVTAAEGAKANFVTSAQFQWNNLRVLSVGTQININVSVASTDSSLCTVIVKYIPVVTGANLS